MNLQKVLSIPKNILKCNLHTSATVNKIQAGRYKVTRNRSKPLTYEQAFWPEQIGIKKGMCFSANSQNSLVVENSIIHQGLNIRSFFFGAIK